jgi:hypothetical protein
MIRTGDGQQISKLIAQLGNEIKGIIRNAFELSYYSRGAWSYESVLNMTAGERDIAADFINKRLEQASKMSFPVF